MLNGADKTQAYNIARDYLAPQFLAESFRNNYDNIQQNGLVASLKYGNQTLFTTDANNYIRNEVYPTLDPADLQQFKTEWIGNGMLSLMGNGALGFLFEGMYRPMLAFGRSTAYGQNFGQGLEVPYMDAETGKPKLVDITLNGQTISGVEVWMDDYGHKDFYKDGQRFYHPGRQLELVVCRCWAFARGT